MVGELHTLRAGAQIASSSDDRPLTTDRTSLLTDGELPVVSVVICTYNRPQLLEAAVRSCLANATRTALKFEIIISDNSLDGHAHPIVTKFCDEAVVVRSVVASPPNIAIARNAGVKAARAPLIAFLDDDAEVYEGWLDALVGTLERTGADAAVGPVHAVFVGEAPKSDKLASRFSRMLSCASGTPIAVIGPQRPRDFAIGTGNSIWRARTCFTDPLPFDPWFGAAGGEDLDLFMRISRRGRQVVWCAEAEASEIVPLGRTSFSNQLLRVFSSAQGYAAASIKNSDKGWLTGVSIMLRGAVQALAYGAATLPLGAVALFGGQTADVAVKEMALKASAGLGKALWWRRLRYYHIEKPHTA